MVLEFRDFAEEERQERIAYMRRYGVGTMEMEADHLYWWGAVPTYEDAPKEEFPPGYYPEVYECRPVYPPGL